MGKENHLGILPPQDLEIEKSVLAAIMLDKEAITYISDIVKPNHFYKEAHSLIFKACLQLFSENEPIDIMTVVSRLRKNGTIELVGGAYYVSEITGSVNSSSNIETHARIIAELSIRRDLIFISSNMCNKSYDETEDIFDLIGRADTELNNVIENNTRSSYVHLGDTITDTMASMFDNKDLDVTGVPSGFKSLDAITGGWQDGNLIILAARPAMGKTAFCVSTMLNAAKQSNTPVGFFSLEMSKEQLNHRVISSETDIDLFKVQKPKLLFDSEWTMIGSAVNKINDYPIYIDDTAGISIIEFKTKARRMKRNHNIGMIVVDYLQLMSGDSKGNREQEISSISRALKGVAKELNIPVIALSQLSRAVESRGGDKKPMLSDLRESGAIEQDADMVIFLYRPEYYGITETEDGMPLQGKGAAIVAKNRQGSIDEVYLRFIGKYTRWQDDSIDSVSLPEISSNKLPEIDSISSFENNPAPF